MCETIRKGNVIDGICYGAIFSASDFHIRNVAQFVPFGTGYAPMLQLGDFYQEHLTEAKIDQLIAYVSQFFTLKIGDIIFTGTPSGVSRVEADDTLKGYIGEDEFFSIKVK